MEAAHRKFQRRLLGVKWYDRVSNVEVRKRTRMAMLEKITKERRLRWLGCVIRMEDCRIANQALNWNLSSMICKPGRPGKTGRTLSEGI